MTCIVGVSARDGEVVLGGDSAGVDGAWGITTRGDSKVFKRGSFVFGFTTSYRMGQLLKDRLKGSDLAKVRSEADLVDKVREVLKAGGWMKLDASREEGGTFLVGWRGRVLEIASDMQYGWSVDGIGACGCGAQFALGYLEAEKRRWSGRPTVTQARRAVRGALKAAAHLSAGVRGPFILRETPA